MDSPLAPLVTLILIAVMGIWALCALVLAGRMAQAVFFTGWKKPVNAVRIGGVEYRR